MSYRLGVDVGGTFTDVLLVEEGSGSTWRAKTASTPADQAVGVLNGIGQVCAAAGIELSEVAQVLHGTTVATNAILEGKGATVGLVTTKGFRQVLQIARSFVPGGLAGWIIWPKPEPLADLENTVEVDERIASDGAGRSARSTRPTSAPSSSKLRRPRHPGAGRLADQLLRRPRARAADRRDRRRGAARRPGVAVVGRAARAARVRAHAHHRRQRLRAAAGEALRAARSSDQLAEGGVAGELAILRSDGGLQSAGAAIGAPVTMLLSGPAGGVTGAVWVAEQCGHRDLITFDMGGTSTDVGAGAGPQPADRPGDQGRRPHRARLQRRRPHGRRRRRLDRPRARADQGAAGRPAVRRRRPGPGRLRQGRHRADGHRRQRRPRLPADVAGRRRDHPGRRGRARRRRRRSPRPWAWSPRRRPRPGSSTSSTRTCSAACGWSRCSRASTRATSPSSRSAAPARCTPTRSAG